MSADSPTPPDGTPRPPCVKRPRIAVENTNPLLRIQESQEPEGTAWIMFPDLPSTQDSQDSPTPPDGTPRPPCVKRPRINGTGAEGGSLGFVGTTPGRGQWIRGAKPAQDRPIGSLEDRWSKPFVKRPMRTVVGKPPLPDGRLRAPATLELWCIRGHTEIIDMRGRSIVDSPLPDCSCGHMPVMWQFFDEDGDSIYAIQFPTPNEQAWEVARKRRGEEQQGQAKVDQDGSAGHGDPAP